MKLSLRKEICHLHSLPSLASPLNKTIVNLPKIDLALSFKWSPTPSRELDEAEEHVVLVTGLYQLS
jgi:hypothetical protein